MENSSCPICGEQTRCSFAFETGDYGELRCRTYELIFFVHNTIIHTTNEEKNKIYNLIFEKTLRTPFKVIDGNKLRWYFFCEENYTSQPSDANYINSAELMKVYPRNVSEKINRALLNLSIKYNKIGDIIDWHKFEYRLVFCDSNNQEREFRSIHNYMKGLGYIDGDPMSGTGKLSYSGWMKVDELNRFNNEKHQGFIAMSFDSEAMTIMNGFKAAIMQAGYSVSVINEKEHNNQIVPEIFHEIQNSKFLVVDVTYPNNGAYYEAGYGYGTMRQN